jgi:hypothetical protein
MKTVTKDEITLKKVRVNERQSQETTCFVADVWIYGQEFATVSNTGEGGSNRIVPCVKNGITFNQAQVLDDLTVEGWIFELVAEYEFVSKNQTKALVLRKNGNYYTCDLPRSIKTILKGNPNALDGLITKNEMEGYTVLNRNIPSDRN